MTKVFVQPGGCGFTVTITAEKGEARKIRITLETDCEMVQKMREDVRELDRTASLMGFSRNPVYRCAAKHLKHAACPVPSAVLKALEVEAGLNVPKDVIVTFEKEKKIP